MNGLLWYGDSMGESYGLMGKGMDACDSKMMNIGGGGRRG